MKVFSRTPGTKQAVALHMAHFLPGNKYLMGPLHTMSQEENSSHKGNQGPDSNPEDLPQWRQPLGQESWGHPRILWPTERYDLSMSSNPHTITPSCVTAGKSISLSGPQNSPL